MFRPMAFTVIFALVGSLGLALTLMPVLCSWFLRGKIKEEDNWLVRFFKAVYTRLLVFALQFRWLVGGAAVLLFASSLFVFTRLGAEFIPQLDEGTMLLHFIRSGSAGLITLNAADKKHLGGPKGGRLLEKTEPKAEFFLEKDHTATITFYDAALKPVLDDPPWRSFATMAEYRAWCAEHLPEYLGFKPAAK